MVGVPPPGEQQRTPNGDAGSEEGESFQYVPSR